MNPSNIKQILFATDGSEYSLGAQKVAIDLTKKCHGELHIMSNMLTTQDLEGVGTQNMRPAGNTSLLMVATPAVARVPIRIGRTFGLGRAGRAAESVTMRITNTVIVENESRVWSTRYSTA